MTCSPQATKTGSPLLTPRTSTLKMSASKPTEVDVAIVGGGIGGLATALAFKRLTNITARVYER